MLDSLQKSLEHHTPTEIQMQTLHESNKSMMISEHHNDVVFRQTGLSNPDQGLHCLPFCLHILDAITVW